ncbi:MAG: class I SAM-dependent methyltransferase [Acetatifactor sp.]|nr:class I SAM-dependent methyltransferase [Acetatifactor sp.]
MKDTEKQVDRLCRIRQNEAASHTEVYTHEKLYASDTWLKKPIKTVQDIMPSFSGYKELRVLDLGCGVGRNSIYIAESFLGDACTIDCVDILDVAIDILKKNAGEHNVGNSINGFTKPIEEFAIPPAGYDLILAVSALEHIDTKQNFINKLREIAHGIRKNGIVCLVINSEVIEVDAETGAILEPNFEVNLKSDQIMTYLDGIFEGWTVIKETVVAQKYEIPRDSKTSRLSTKVISFVAQRVSDE